MWVWLHEFPITKSHLTLYPFFKRICAYEMWLTLPWPTTIPPFFWARDPLCKYIQDGLRRNIRNEILIFKFKWNCIYLVLYKESLNIKQQSIADLDWFSVLSVGSTSSSGVTIATNTTLCYYYYHWDIAQRMCFYCSPQKATENSMFIFGVSTTLSA